MISRKTKLVQDHFLLSVCRFFSQKCYTKVSMLLHTNPTAFTTGSTAFFLMILQYKIYILFFTIKWFQHYFPYDFYIQKKSFRKKNNIHVPIPVLIIFPRYIPILNPYPIPITISIPNPISIPIPNTNTIPTPIAIIITFFMFFTNFIQQKKFYSPNSYLLILPSCGTYPTSWSYHLIL